MVEVTQEDRDAAAQFFGYKGYAGAFSAWTQLGSTLDLEAACVAFARHRQACVQQGLDMAAGALEEQAKATPLGHENIQRGASTYNWLMSHARLIRKLGANDGTD